jgi:hypothetical protein
MGQGTSFQQQAAGFHDSASTTTPSYDFVARPKKLMPSANPTFAGVPVADQSKPLAQAFVPERAPGLPRPVKALVALVLVGATAVLAVFAGGYGLRAYRAHVRASVIQHTSVAFPQSIAGLTKKTTAAAVAQAGQLLAAVPTPAPPRSATYATKSHLGLVFAGAYAMSDADQRDYLTSAGDSATALGFTLTKVAAGPRGGEMWCGANAPKAETFCAFADVAAYGAMVVPGVGAQGQAIAATFRTAVEQRS